MVPSPAGSEDDHMNPADAPHRTSVGPTTLISAAATETAPAATGTVADPARRLDAESQAWIERLGSQSPEREAAIEALHALLLKTARFEVNRRRAAFPHLRGDDHDDLAHQSANDALVAVLSKLDDFRGDSRFTTWAHKFAIFEAAATVRRRAWQGREIPLEPQNLALIADRGSTPHEDVETKELLGALHDAIESGLSRHQRDVLVAVTINDVPIDVLAERLDTTRGALYKTIHDARHKLRAALA
jgi:RNA polymerase sigma-70 factor, ECF subfamily